MYGVCFVFVFFVDLGCVEESVVVFGVEFECVFVLLECGWQVIEIVECDVEIEDCCDVFGVECEYGLVVLVCFVQFVVFVQ